MTGGIQKGFLVASMLLGSPVFAADPGAVAPPAGQPLIDGTTGEAWSKVTASGPAAFTLTGPARFQVGFRLNLPADPNDIPPAGIIQVRHGGKPLAQFRVNPKPGKDTWKDEAVFKPSASVGFLVEVAPGDQVYEFRLNGGAAAGGAVYVIDAAKSTRPLAANAPVVPIPAAPIVATAPTPAPSATPTPSIDATPAPGATPAPTSGGRDSAALALWLGAGGGSQTRTFVTGRAPASDVAFGVRYLPMRSVLVSFAAGYEATEDLVPLPEAPVDRVKENRLLIDAMAGYRLSAAAATLSVGPSIRYAAITNDVVDYDWIYASAAGRLEIPLGMVTVAGGGEAGVPVSDGTPSGWNDGELETRYAWSGSLRYTTTFAASPSVGLEYRGEHLSRRYSQLTSHGLWLLAQVEF